LVVVSVRGLRGVLMFSARVCEILKVFVRQIADRVMFEGC
jgi:hypothetical protein